MAEQLLDRYRIDIAILTGEEAIEASTLANPHYAQALVRACNDWMVAEWLPLDDRLRGSLVVASQDPRGAAAEMRRLGAPRGSFSSSSRRAPSGALRGPVLRPDPGGVRRGRTAAGRAPQRAGRDQRHPTGCGPPTFFCEIHALLCETGTGHVASTIAQGVFERWPGARLVIIECGIAWLAALLWRPGLRSAAGRPAAGRMGGGHVWKCASGVEGRRGRRAPVASAASRSCGPSRAGRRATRPGDVRVPGPCLPPTEGGCPWADL